jgi:hypothetical protein
MTRSKEKKPAHLVSRSGLPGPLSLSVDTVDVVSCRLDVDV